MLFEKRICTWVSMYDMNYQNKTEGYCTEVIRIAYIQKFHIGVEMSEIKWINLKNTKDTLYN